MRSFPWLAALSFITFSTLSAQSASAQSEASPQATTSPPTEVTPLDAPATTRLHVSWQLGGYGGGAADGVAMGALFLVQRGLLEVGAQGQVGAGLFEYGYGSLGALAGVGLSPFEHWRLDLLGELGIDAYSHFDDGGILSDDPGASAVVPYGGARVALTRGFGDFELGLSGGYANDLGRRNVSYTYSDTGLFGGAPTPESRTVRVGTERLSGMLLLGGACNL